MSAALLYILLKHNLLGSLGFFLFQQSMYHHQIFSCTILGSNEDIATKAKAYGGIEIVCFRYPFFLGLCRFVIQILLPKPVCVIDCEVRVGGDVS
jgi:hypothetical protein